MDSAASTDPLFPPPPTPSRLTHIPVRPTPTPEPLLSLTDSEWESVQAEARQLYNISKLHDFQIDTAKGLMNGEKRILIAGTGAGKSIVWVLPALALQLKKQEGMIIIISVTKAMQDDQVSFDSRFEC
jgi:ATP-dependent helicase YprA (DUF1998 family)